MLPHMEAYILQEGVLHLARHVWNDIRVATDLPDQGRATDSSAKRHTDNLLCGSMELLDRVTEW